MNKKYKISKKPQKIYSKYNESEINEEDDEILNDFILDSFKIYSIIR